MTAAKADTKKDPVQSVAETIEAAGDALRDGAADASRKAEQVLPSIGDFAAKTVYSTFYYLSYGACFATLMATRAIPTENAFGHGLKDGADAASDAVDRIYGRGEDEDWDGPLAEEEEQEHQAATKAAVKKGNRSKVRKIAAKRAKGEVSTTAEEITSDTELSDEGN